MTMLNRPAAAGHVGERSEPPADPGEEIAPNVKKQEKTRLRNDRRIRHAEETRLYLPIGNDGMPA